MKRLALGIVLYLHASTVYLQDSNIFLFSLRDYYLMDNTLTTDGNIMNNELLLTDGEVLIN